MTKKTWLTAAAALAVAIGSAQTRERPSPPDSKEIAQRRTVLMKERLGLSDKQTKKVYKINLRQAQKTVSAMSASGPSEGPRTGGGPGGQGGPGGGMRGGPGGSMRGGMGTGMGAPGGGSGGPGGGMPGGDRQMDTPRGGPGTGEMTAPVYNESDKETAKREKKMRKILDSSQYEEWRMMEAERLREEFHTRMPIPEFSDY